MRLAIPGETFARAVAIGEYFLAHAILAFALMGGDETTALAKRLWAWVERTGAKEFSAADGARATRAKPAPIAAALGALEARGLIRPLPLPPPTGGRPASPRYQVRP